MLTLSSVDTVNYNDYKSYSITDIKNQKHEWNQEMFQNI